MVHGHHRPAIRFAAGCAGLCVWAGYHSADQRYCFGRRAGAGWRWAVSLRAHPPAGILRLAGGPVLCKQPASAADIWRRDAVPGSIDHLGFRAVPHGKHAACRAAAGAGDLDAHGFGTGIGRDRTALPAYSPPHTLARAIGGLADAAAVCAAILGLLWYIP